MKPSRQELEVMKTYPGLRNDDTMSELSSTQYFSHSYSLYLETICSFHGSYGLRSFPVCMPKSEKAQPIFI